MPSHAFIQSRLSSLHNRAADWIVERRLGIRTTGRKDVEVDDAVPYSTFSYAQINDVLDRLELGPGDVFADVGCGKGRVVCAAALRPIRQAIGIDIDTELCARARANAKALRGRNAPIEIVNVPAQGFDYQACTAMLLFNPFNFATLRAMLGAIIASREANAAPMRIAYVNPRCESVLRDAGVFEQYDFNGAAPGSRMKFDVAFWRMAQPRTASAGSRPQRVHA